ncbi:MAG: polysaccharide pyruvyl transferase family protein [Paucimonas sp.]|jgi:succinoglycan biosynthesis protein ExoV|nr:polysaccharide pyruvyl transferase family protein [Paucimonas sp.]
MKGIFAAGSANVGDELNEWLLPALLGDIQRDKVAVLGIGTLLNTHFCRRLEDAGQIMVLGTGAGYGAPPALDQRWHFHAVRGRRTARMLGLAADRAVADAAYLLASLDWRRSAHRHGEVVVVPHHRSLRYLDWQHVCERAGVRFLSPLLPAGEFMQVLAGARLVLSEAMHGAILADIARVPWQGFGFGGQFNLDKWLDWAEMFELDLDIHPLPGFYDPARFSEGRPLRYHLAKVLKVHASRVGLGREKWKRMTLPAFRLEQAQARLVRQLKALAQQPGMLSSDDLLRLRVDQLYQRVEQLRAQLQAPAGRRLEGDGIAFLRNVMVPGTA